LLFLILSASVFCNIITLRCYADRRNGDQREDYFLLTDKLTVSRAKFATRQNSSITICAAILVFPEANEVSFGGFP